MRRALLMEACSDLMCTRLAVKRGFKEVPAMAVPSKEMAEKIMVAADGSHATVSDVAAGLIGEITGASGASSSTSSGNSIAQLEDLVDVIKKNGIPALPTTLALPKK